jgi:hypothetical protein
MNRILTSIIFLTIFVSCKNDSETKNAQQNLSVNTSNPIKMDKISESELQKFFSVKEMLADAGDFSTENGTLKIIDGNSKNPKIQISEPIVKGDLDEIIEKFVKRDIVYVAFQSFAQTPTEKITITSIPVDLEDRTKYYPKYEKTMTITKKSTDQIMIDEFGSTDYSILFNKMNNIEVPSKEFDKLKFDKLDEIFDKLK